MGKTHSTAVGNSLIHLTLMNILVRSLKVYVLVSENISNWARGLYRNKYIDFVYFPN